MFTRCNYRCGSKWAGTLVTLVLTLVFFFSCTRNTVPKENYANLLPVKPDILLELPDSFSLQQLWSEEIPGVTSLMASDLLGDKRVELICSDSLNTFILGVDGNLLSSFSLDNGDIPALTRDMDDDGKQDIIYHNPLGPRAGIRVFNGLGTELASFNPTVEGLKFAGLSVEADDEDNIYIRLNTDNIKGNRGYMKLSLPNFEPVWFFAVPFTPEKLFPVTDGITSKVIKLYPGLITTTTGMYAYFGKEMIPRLDLEVDFSYFYIAANGNHSEPIHLTSGGSYPLQGRIRYLKENSNGFILLHESDYFASAMFRIVSINNAGKITNESDFIAGVPESRVETKAGDIILTVSGAGGTKKFYLISAGYENNLEKGPLISLSSKNMNSFPPYTVTANTPSEFTSMTNFLFLSNLNDKLQFPEYALATDGDTVKFFKIIPD